MMTAALKMDAKYSYKDYLNWPEGERWELIVGVPYSMSPAPTPRHQKVSMVLAGEIYAYLKGKKGQFFAAPFDVRLAANDKLDEFVDSVVQPDLLVICDESKIDERGCAGAPDMTIEILSESTAGKDLHDKKDLYER